MKIHLKKNVNDKKVAQRISASLLFQKHYQVRLEFKLRCHHESPSLT